MMQTRLPLSRTTLNGCSLAIFPKSYNVETSNLGTSIGSNILEKWIYSGEQIRDVSTRSLHRPSLVSSFLSGERKFIILSSKGMGKTHLLRQKRSLLADSPEGRSSVFIPSASGSDVDRQTSLPQSKSVSFWANLSQTDWAILWEISISLSAVLSSNLDLDDEELSNQLERIALDENVPKDLEELILLRLDGERPGLAKPTYILNALLELNQGELGKLLRKAPNLILHLYPHYVTSAVYIFIDSFDQTLSETLSGQIDHWVNGQTGLALAAYNVFTNCSHIKVFTSIRQEAWNKFTHENKMAMESYCLELRYSKEELRSMIDFLAKYYEGKSSFSDMFSTNNKSKIRNYGICVGNDEYIEEDLFDYVYRHSLGSPRSILHLISSISYLTESNLSPDPLEREIRKEVNLKSGSLAATKIESEMAQFLTFLQKKTDQISLFSQVHNNVLSYVDLKQISEAANLDGAEAHPFCELWNLGLLGCLRRNSDGEVTQTFKSPLEFDWQLHNCLPRSKYYVMHPSISALLANQYRMLVEPGALVEPEAAWNKEWDRTIEMRSVKIFISYSTENVDLRNRVISVLSQTFLMEGLRHEIWVDEREISGFEQITSSINEGIDWADIMICLVTTEYLSSSWCNEEFNTMHTLELNNRGKKLLPYVFRDADRTKLGNLASSRLIPKIDEDDAAGLMVIGQHARNYYRKKLLS